ncbi:hypothetical protein [Azonexus sp.]|jgi:hypothetical protein|uniref:hypothetical protein n=1 Tax=Azonexus sp. TaxID=1872668 RepID=UPI002816EC63|nr:hypothetical protein [Azonexus sp.]MDR1995498.1 hypothetical protein [Azonexus sp.]
MNEIIAELSRPAWWVSVVFAGVIINLLSAYLKSPLDKIVSKSFSLWRNKSEARKAAWHARIEGIRQDDRFRDSAVAYEIRLRFQSVYLLLMGIVALALSSFMLGAGLEITKLFVGIIFGYSSLMFFGSFLAYINATNVANELKEGYSRRPE